MAKTDAEFIKSSIESQLAGSDAKVKVVVTDSYQAYVDGKNEYLFAAKIEITAKEKVYRYARFTIDAIRSGPKEAVEWIENSVTNVRKIIKAEFKKR
jgi:hypothetical protein